MFRYKTQKEIADLTDEQVEVYAKELKAYESNVRKIEIEAATKVLSDELATVKTASGELQEQINVLKETAEGKKAIEKGTFVKFVEETIANKTLETAQGSNKHVIKVAALMTTANVLPNVANGFSPLFGNYIDTEIGNAPKPENIILPLVTVKNQPGTESIYFTDRINEDGDAEFIAEGALKPLADADYQATKREIKEVALRWKFSNRLINHAPSVVSDFATHAQELIDDKIDDQLLEGTGLTVNIAGLQTLASAFIVPTGLAGYYAAPNIYDVIMAMATRVMLSNFKGQLTVILNTVWMAKMAGIKDSQNRYIVAPFVSVDGKRVGSVNVQFSNKIGTDAILLGDLKKFNAVFSENVAYYEGYENDDFSKNLVSKKLEAFLGTYIKASHAGAILFGDISDIQDDLVIVTP
jgi:hypothetical protein